MASNFIPTRREIIQSGAAAAALAPLASAPVFAASRMPIYKVVVDERFPAAKFFAAEVARQGADVHATQGDVTSLWYNDLYHRWRASPAAIAGLTNYNTFFVLEMFAQDAGLRTVYRAHHRHAEGTVEHDVYGPHAVLRQQAALGDSDAEWATNAAGIVMRWPAGQARLAKSESTIGRANERMIGSDTMISWVMAPRRA